MKKTMFGLLTAVAVIATSFTACKTENGSEFSLNSQNLSLNVGDEFTLIAENVPEGSTVTWAAVTEPENIVELVADGNKVVVKGLAEGAGVITAKLGDVTKRCQLAVVNSIVIPEIKTPEAGKATVAILIPEGTACNGIVLMGSIDNSTWGELAKFEQVKEEGFENWYTATITLGEVEEEKDKDGNVLGIVGFSGKVCLDMGNGSWDGESKDNKNIEDLTTADAWNIDGGGDNLKISKDGGIVGIQIGAWKSSPCVSEIQYTITLIAPDCTKDDAKVQLKGGFDGWGAGADLVKGADGKWTCTITGKPNNDCKFCINDWAEELQYQKEEDGELKWFNYGDGKNYLVLGTDANITFDAKALGLEWTSCHAEE